MQLAVGGCQRGFIGIHPVAEAVLFIPYMTVQHLTVTTVFRQGERAAVRVRRTHLEDVFVDAFVISRTLVVPTAGVVNGAGGVQSP